MRTEGGEFEMLRVYVPAQQRLHTHTGHDLIPLPGLSRRVHSDMRASRYICNCSVAEIARQFSPQTSRSSTLAATRATGADQ